MPSGEAASLMANSTRGIRSGQLSCRSLTKARSTSSMTPLTRSTLLVVLWWCCDPKIRVEPSARWREVHEPHVAIRDDGVGKPDGPEDRCHKVQGCCFRRGRLECGDQPYAPRKQVNVHLQEIMARARPG